MKPILQFEPHELEPGHRADDDLESNENEYEFRGQWLDGEDDFRVRTTWLCHAPAIFFALVNEPERGHFVCCPKYAYPGRPKGELIYRLPHHQEPEEAREILPIYCERPWGRLYFLDENWNIAGDKPAHRRLFLSFDGWGELCTAPKFDEGDCMFRWNPMRKARELARMSPVDLLGLFLPELLDSQSDAAFVDRFAPMERQERHELCCPLKRGSYDEWKNVLALWTRSRAKLWELNCVRAVFKTGGPSTAAYIFASPRRQTDFDAAVLRFRDWTQSYFKPMDASLVLKHWAAARWAPHATTFNVRVERPTFHEQIESLIELRAWMSDKATPTEIEELLHQ